MTAAEAQVKQQQRGWNREAMARRVFMSARLFGAGEAHDLGLLARVVAPEDLDACIEKALAGLEVILLGVDHHHTGRFEAGCGHALDAVIG